MSVHQDRGRASSFGDDAVQYDRARPSYPTALVEHLLQGAPAAILDVGCGTGIAPRLLSAAGRTILGVEPDERMAEVARAAGVAVEVGDFESWDPRGRRFDLMISAQAWHWVDPVGGPAKAANVIRRGGRFSCFWNVGRPNDDLRSAFDAVYERLAPHVEEYSVLLGHGGPGRFTGTAEAFAADGHFDGIETTSFHHAVRYSSAMWIDQLGTHSDHRALAPNLQRELYREVADIIDRRGGEIEFSYETVCVEGRRAHL